MRDQWFTWTVEIKVHETWVQDGFNITDEKAKEIIEAALPYADGCETKAKVICEPDQERLAKCQGYKSAEAMKADAGQ